MSDRPGAGRERRSTLPLGVRGMRTGQDRGPSQSRVLPQNCLDLGRFDAEAPDLDLVVDAPQKLDIPIAAPACNISGLIQSRLWHIAEGVWDKPLGGQLGTVDVPARQPRTANVQLPGHADR